MKKQNTQKTMLSNLRDATESGIWMHCFVFFGFPGETATDAAETMRFVSDNADIISSFGCGTFSLEHNAPMWKHPDRFPIQILEREAQH